MDRGEASLRIAMVDDDADDIFLTKMAFKKTARPFQFFGMASGDDLFDYIKDNGIGSLDLLLLDVNMPISDGHAVLAKLNTYPHFGDLCTVMFSTSRLAVDKQFAKRLGATAYAVKPSTLRESADFVQAMWDIIKIKASVRVREHA